MAIEYSKHQRRDSRGRASLSVPAQDARWRRTLAAQRAKRRRRHQNRMHGIAREREQPLDDEAALGDEESGALHCRRIGQCSVNEQPRIFVRLDPADGRPSRRYRVFAGVVSWPF